MKPLLIALSFIAFSFHTGCKKSNNNSEAKLELSNEEILQLMEAEVFEVIVPDDIQPEDFAGLAMLKPDGSIKPFSSGSQWEPGEVVKVVCFKSNEARFEYAISRGGFFGRSSTSNFPATKGSISIKHRGITEGEGLMRFSLDDSINMSDSPEGDDFDIIFHVQKRTLLKEDDSFPKRGD